jgi:hypothetical protein
VVENPGDAQRPPEGTAPHCQREAGRVWVQVRASTRQSARRIGSKAVTSLFTDRHDTQ